MWCKIQSPIEIIKIGLWGLDVLNPTLVTATYLFILWAIHLASLSLISSFSKKGDQ